MTAKNSKLLQAVSACLHSLNVTKLGTRILCKVQLNLDYLYLDDLDVFSSPNFEYLLFMIKNHSNIFFKTIALKRAVKSECFCFLRGNAVLTGIVINQ